MKKFLLFSFVMLFSTLLKAQVSMEEIGDFRYIYGSNAGGSIYTIQYKGFIGAQNGSDGDFGGRVSPGYRYTTEKTKKGTIKYWSLDFTGTCKRNGFTMKKGGKIMLRLFDGSVITLYANSVGIDEDYEVGTYFTPSAKLTEANFNRITKSGVKKVRFETYPKVYDVEYKEDIIGVFLKDASKILKEKINDKTDRMSKGF